MLLFQDVSDRIEKLEVTDYIVACLEAKGRDVVKNDWRKHITEELREGML